MRPRLALALGAALAVVALTLPLPVLDEESYLAIAHGLDPWRPYDWLRSWPPLDAGNDDNAYVFAHPPLFLLWAWAWARLTPTVGAIKVAAALPWAALAGWSVGRLAERLSVRPWLAAAAWGLSPITLLAVQRGLMPDLMVTALGLLAVVAWLEGWRVLGGVALGLAAWTKYPALLLVVPLLAHRRARQDLPFWIAAALTWGVGEGWLWALYGRPHLWEVLSRADEIARGPLGGRALGTAARLALGLTALPLLMAGWRRGWLVAAALALPLAWWGAPTGSAWWMVPTLAAFATVGLVLLWVAARALGPEPQGRLLGAWALVVVLGVLLGHNFAAPRYLFPAMAPLALLVVRAVERRRDGRTLLVAGLLVQALLSVGLVLSEHHYATAADRLARRVIAQHPEPAWFAGEWGFRWRLESAGWHPAAEGPASGAWVVLPEQAAPPPALSDWTPEATLEDDDRFPLRVLCAACGVGFYSETIGPLPLGWSHQPVETVHIWRAP